MTKLITITMGLGQNPSGKCLGLREWGDRIAQKYDAQVMYLGWRTDITTVIKMYKYDKLMMIGHSFGGARSVEAAGRLAQVDRLVLLDPVPIDGWGFMDSKSFQIPASVVDAWCYHRKAILPPWSCPIRGGVKFRNTKLKISHNKFASSPNIQCAMDWMVKTL